MAAHEYSVVGHNRSKIGMIISVISGIVAGAVTAVAGFVSVFLSDMGFTIPEIIMWPITGAVVFGILFLLFDNVFWKHIRLRGIVGVPDISGTWMIEGKSFNLNTDDEYPWTGTIEITQCYEKITLFLKTKLSSAHSITAAIINEGNAGYKLIYSYRNQPKPGEVELQSHLGHCEILFAPNCATAEGQYFNGLGRATHGTMKLTKEIK